jgi:urease accessory protein
VTDEATLATFRLVDSFLPVGTDSVSYGLEQFVAADRVTDADDLRSLIETYLRDQHARADLIALRTAHAATADGDLEGVRRADRRLVAVTLPAEFRESSTRTGGRLLALQRELQDDAFLERYDSAVADDDAPGTYPVVLGVTTSSVGISVREACLLACHEFVTAQLAAAQRLLQLGHTEVQVVLDDVQPAMVEAVAASAGRPIDSMDTFTPLVELLAAEHERANRRLFVS